MENLIIRKATENDLDTLHQFEQGVIEAERPFDVTMPQGQIHYYDLKYLMTSEKAQLLVGEINGRVVASGYAKIVPSDPWLMHKQHAHIGFIYVVPDLRGRGISKVIIENLTAWARQQNINEVRLEVYFGNTPAIKAYEKMGFVKHMLEMRLG